MPLNSRHFEVIYQWGGQQQFENNGNNIFAPKVMEHLTFQVPTLVATTYRTN